MIASPEWLTCWKCGNRGIPAPEGATPQTRYICPGCAPVNGDSLVHFDRCQFDRPRGSQFSKENLLKFLESETEQVLQRSAPSVERARRKGAAWVLWATVDNLCQLPRRSRQALLLTAWCGLKSAEAAEIMETKPQTVRALAFYARRLLSAMGDI